ncbi:MAG TPA: isoaspartyl peptidase/L-asparaginase [Bacteroidia bacterium]|jgi:beta-aspartyl-peptidase (threonine type)|nr:isoaspartyl peptidase/L-asparaginase [Bacteroidia bacterium]
MTKHIILIHGGAGTILRSSMTPELEIQYRKALQSALKQGDEVLKKGGSALDAVEAAIVVLEDNPLYNAGKGSVFTYEGKNEMDASIMCGQTLKAGAVSGLRHVKNPVKLAREVMDHSEHVYLCGSGAEEFAKSRNVTLEPESYFFTQQRYDQLMAIRDSGKTQMDHSDKPSEKKFGTVGAVALDMQGNLAACTSTGGMTNKRFGRVGDTPIIGAGTYANNNSCAVSCTGHGELFIRAVVAHDVSCLVEYGKQTLKQACEEVVLHKLVEMGGEGGLIALDRDGNAQLIFNSEGMYRGIKRADGDFEIAIYKD